MGQQCVYGFAQCYSNCFLVTDMSTVKCSLGCVRCLWLFFECKHRLGLAVPFYKAMNCFIELWNGSFQIQITRRLFILILLPVLSSIIFRCPPSFILHLLFLPFSYHFLLLLHPPLLHHSPLLSPPFLLTLSTYSSRANWIIVCDVIVEVCCAGSLSW